MQKKIFEKSSSIDKRDSIVSKDAKSATNNNVETVMSKVLEDLKDSVSKDDFNEIQSNASLKEEILNESNQLYK